ncbi:hypothetical protein [Janibacter terrae]|uniref:hypothetical protein n=1 Tax=Janibacter terrae TaxID=103817 RepID=UPI0031F8F23A
MHHPTPPSVEAEPKSTTRTLVAGAVATAAGMAAATTFLAIVGVAARALGILQ